MYLVGFIAGATLIALTTGPVVSAALPAALPATGEPGVLSGAWEAEILGPQMDLYLRIPGRARAGSWNLGAACDSLAGLQSARSQTAGCFEMTVDAGRFLFVGKFGGTGEEVESGRGGFTFVPDPAYAADLMALGIVGVQPEDFLTLAERGVSHQALRNLLELGYRVPTLEQLLGMTRSIGPPRALRLFDPEG